MYTASFEQLKGVIQFSTYNEGASMVRLLDGYGIIFYP
jgi:hypothetical protein